jgi:DNA-binding transcriptional LysR family regulator
LQRVQLPDLNLLVVLDALLQEQSVSRAATRLGLSTPAASHALARLRVRLGDPLLVRAGQRMTLTPRAASMRERVEATVVEALGVFAPEQPRDIRTLERVFRIHASDHAVTVLGTAIDKLVRVAPKVSLQFLPSQADEAARLRAGAVDLAIGVYDYSPYSDLPSELRIQQLLDDRFACVVRAGHPTVKRTVSLRQFAELSHVQVAPRGQPGGYVDDLLAERKLSRTIVRAVPYFLAGLVLVAETDYVMTLSARLARRMARKLGLRVLEPPRELGLEPYAVAQIWHPRDDHDAGHRWLRDAIVRAGKSVATS